MRPIRWALMSMPLAIGALLAGCGYHTERTVYTPTPTAAAPVAVVPSSGYYYTPAATYYSDPYRPVYYTSY